MTQRKWGTAHIPTSVTSSMTGNRREVKWECVDQGLDYAIAERKAHRLQSKSGTMCNVSFDHIYREVVAIVEAGRAAWAYEEVQNKAQKYVDTSLKEDVADLHTTAAVVDGWEDFELFMKRVRNLTSYLESEWINNHRGAIDSLFVSSRCLWFDNFLSETPIGKDIQAYLIDLCHDIIHDNSQQSEWMAYSRLMSLIKTLDVRRYNKYFAKPFKSRVLSDFSELYLQLNHSNLDEYVNFLCSTLSRLRDHLTKVQVPENTIQDVHLSILSSVFQSKNYSRDLFEAAVVKRNLAPILQLMQFSNEVKGSPFIDQLFEQVISITTRMTLKQAIEETTDAGSDENSTVKVIVNYLQFIRDLGKNFSEVQQQQLNIEGIKTINEDQDLTVKAMSTYLDNSIKQAQKKDSLEDIEDAWKVFADIYKVVDSKDTIEDLTRIKLSYRLIEIGKNVTDMKLAIETEVIRLFKLTATNSSCVRQMEEMIKDIATSSEDLDKYIEHRKQYYETTKTASFLILKPSCWPAFKHQQMQIHDSLQTQIDSFTQYFVSTHQKKVLTWYTDLGSITLIAILNRRRHMITGPLIDGSVLLSNFQDNDSQTCSEIFETYDVGQSTDEPELKKSLGRLIWNKLLTTSGPVPTNMAKMAEFLTPDRKLTLNLKPPQKVNIRRKAGGASQATKSTANNAARNGVVDAAIVRIMKSKKECSFTDLIEKVIAQVQTRFKPEISFIKRRIETLIDRAFLSRKEGDINTFLYQG